MTNASYLVCPTTSATVPSDDKWSPSGSIPSIHSQHTQQNIWFSSRSTPFDHTSNRHHCLCSLHIMHPIIFPLRQAHNSYSPLHKQANALRFRHLFNLSFHALALTAYLCSQITHVTRKICISAFTCNCNFLDWFFFNLFTWTLNLLFLLSSINYIRSIGIYLNNNIWSYPDRTKFTCFFISRWRFIPT